MACQYSLVPDHDPAFFKARGLCLNLFQQERHFRANVETRLLPQVTLITSLLSPLLTATLPEPLEVLRYTYL